MADIKNIIERIKELKKLQSDAKVAHIIGTTRANLSNHKQRGTIPYEKIASFCERENLSLEYVLYGSGNSTVPDPIDSSNVTRFPPPEAAPEEEFFYIPQVSGKIAAGHGRAPENEVHVRVAFRKAWIKKKGPPDKMSLIKIKGDSMEPTISSGDMILVDHSKNYIDPQGGIYAILMDDMIMIKRLQALGQGRIRIVSDNPHYEPVETTSDDLAINGKVLWICRELER